MGERPQESMIHLVTPHERRHRYGRLLGSRTVDLDQTLTHLCRLQQFYWHMYKMPSPPLITVPGSQTMPCDDL
jgi:hypothetical protein